MGVWTQGEEGERNIEKGEYSCITHISKNEHVKVKVDVYVIMEWNFAACGRKCYHLLNIRQVLIGICLRLFKLHGRWTRNEMRFVVIILMIINKDILNTWTDANLTLPFANTCFILHPHGRFRLKPMFSKIQDYLANNCIDGVCKCNKVNLFL